MLYIGTFLEGIIAFVSPCFLPLLPIYVSFFAGDTSGDGKGSKKRTLRMSLAFVIGFSTVFIALGALSAKIGTFLYKYQTIINIVTGAFVLLVGLNFLGVLNIKFLNNTRQVGKQKKPTSFISTFLFGTIFAISWTPCISPYLGTALSVAMNSSSTLQGIILLLCFSLGIGIPLIISALLIDELNHVFDWLQKHSSTITKISGAFLCVVGVLMMFGLLNHLLSALSIIK